MTESSNQTRKPLSKPVLRQKVRALRRGIPEQQRARFDRTIRQHLWQLIESRAASSVAAYWPFDGEPDMIPLCRQLFKKGIRIALPKVAKTGYSMEFHAWRPDLKLQKNRFGIPEPVDTAKKILVDFDVLIMPLVAYDHHGNRLGVGSGYYDRYLESARNSAVPLRVGVAYSLQEVEQVGHDDRDIPLHGLINENGWFTFAH